jgi:hypothetical protein
MSTFLSIVRCLPPPLTPPHKGEGDLACGSFPSPLWGGVRGGGAPRVIVAATFFTRSSTRTLNPSPQGGGRLP